ncbi:hypothetical protein BY996DRAFT_6535742 [Phakopsora pachyrhizi]|nr:hypothetical protein BY996DRAFT_6535742 [Phakopsora pachyrhizi]
MTLGGVGGRVTEVMMMWESEGQGWKERGTAIDQRNEEKEGQAVGRPRLEAAATEGRIDRVLERDIRKELQ